MCCPDVLGVAEVGTSGSVLHLWSYLVPFSKDVTSPCPGPLPQGPGGTSSGCQAAHLVWDPPCPWASPLEERITHQYRPLGLHREAYLPSCPGLWGKGTLPIWGPSPPVEVTVYSACTSLFIPQSTQHKTSWDSESPHIKVSMATHSLQIPRLSWSYPWAPKRL